ncbi:MAG TPA: phenylalanine--tRNA ligase beta subunit-related protein [Magnetospirillaceae bacterium]|nr:phenylalanine--tRNA ligase beta subunit-related protein [Magnetospirillaceae bacterium]
MSSAPALTIDPVLEPRKLRIGLVWGLGLADCAPTLEPSASLAALLGEVAAAGEGFLAAERRASVRNMLRFGVYKPAGRSRPSSEYLFATALTGSFPVVNGPVDSNNEVSLRWGYPCSIFDLGKTGVELQISRGRTGERYTFNASGQEIDLEDLIVVRRRVNGAWEACGTPVKDSMETKVFQETRNVVGIVYAPITDPKAELEACAARFAGILREECGALETGWLLT